ncbi:pentapeptide repeat-containing protein, partial [Helicobacter sp. MIT 01-3238]|uniref:pentapeptide repeat-containing protein n=1 Tax=Helicobacter sp. MIT 01-3238 TaxID=398627 RepID=UPI000E1E45DE
PKQQIYENLHFDFAKDKLILTIKQGKSFVFENVLDSACEKCKNPQDELYNAIQKQNDKYFINKPLQICADIESNKCDEKSKESKRKIIYIQDELSFKNCVFNGEVRFEYICFAPLSSKAHNDSEAKHNEKNPNDFRQSTQPLRLDFQHCEFHKRVYFTNCEFNGNVFFNHAVFERYADFHESIFNGVVSFYNAEFKYAPNFSTCVFQNLQATNFINVKIDDIDFDKVKQFIKEYRIDGTYQNKLNSLKQQYSQGTNEYKTQKQTLDNNHKIRYASNARDSFRTIKNVLITNNNLLDACAWHKLELYAKEIELRLPTPESKKNPSNERKKCIEKIQLCFYRHTSAHHTDLLESIKSLLIVIGIFGVLSCAVIVGFSLYCGFWDYNPHILTKCYDKYIKCFLANHYCWATIINLALFGAFIVIFIATILCQNVRKLAFYLSCVITLALFIASPKYLIPPIEIFTDKRMLLDPLSVAGGVYSILFGFMLYSFIKTARKNSIIPS